MKVKILVVSLVLLASLISLSIFGRNSKFKDIEIQSVVGAELQTPAPKPAIYCGAITKKGTACKRRVKKAGDRCWQHKLSARIQEDDPEWNWKTLGNKIRGHKGHFDVQCKGNNLVEFPTRQAAEKYFAANC